MITLPDCIRHSGQGRARIGLVGLAIVTTLLLSGSRAKAQRAYGVSTYHGAYGGAAVAGPNGAAVRGPEGAAAAVGPNGSKYYRPPTSTGAYYRPPAVAPLPAGYVHTIPAGYRTTVYHGQSCYFVGGVYYRPEFYGGSTVYVVVH